MGIHQMLGLSRREPITATQRDRQHFQEKTAAWRQRIRQLVADFRHLEAHIGEDRHMMHRHLQILELEMLRGQINLAWNIYRVVQQDARTIETAYFEQNSGQDSLNGDITGRQRSA